MSKPIHPHAETLRAGQTIYMVSFPMDFDARRWRLVLHSYMLGPVTTPLPWEGQIVRSPLNVEYLRSCMRRFPQLRADLFYSRRRAESYMQKL